MDDGMGANGSDTRLMPWNRKCRGGEACKKLSRYWPAVTTGAAKSRNSSSAAGGAGGASTGGNVDRNNVPQVVWCVCFPRSGDPGLLRWLFLQR
jgi:hypothetical protein